MPVLFLLEAALLVGGPYLLWRWGRMRGMAPLAVVQIMVGLILGPSVLGDLAPELQAHLFPEDNVARIGSVAMIAVVLYAFITGMHLDFGALKTVRGLHWIAAGSFLLPLALGIGLGVLVLFVDPTAAGERSEPWMFACAMGMLIAVTALPVLAALLRESGLVSTSLGQQALGLAAVNDAALWIGLSLMLLAVSGTHGEGPGPLYVPVYLLGLMALRWCLEYKMASGDDDEPGDGLLVIGCVIAFLAAYGAEMVGLGYVFGGFLAGVIVPMRLRKALLERLEWPTTFLLMPFFFMATGLRTEADLLSPTLAWLVIAATTVAIGGKMFGTAIPAMLAGQSAGHAMSLGLLLQTKGLMEVLVLTILLDAQIISSLVFSALVLMAVICTASAMPLVHLVTGRTKDLRTAEG